MKFLTHGAAPSDDHILLQDTAHGQLDIPLLVDMMPLVHVCVAVRETEIRAERVHPPPDDVPADNVVHMEIGDSGRVAGVEDETVDGIAQNFLVFENATNKIIPREIIEIVGEKRRDLG